MFKKLVFTGFVLMFVSGCASVKPVEFVGPSGAKAYSMKCSGLGRTLEKCYKKAGEICPSGYSIIDRASSTVAGTFNGQLIAAPQHSLTIECK